MFNPSKRAIDSRPADSSASRCAGDLSTWSDQELLAEYGRSRDQEAFAQIAARHGVMVFRTCLRLVNNVHDAEDAAQAVFLLLARQPQRASGSLAGWLYKVSRDTAITLLRSRARRARKEAAAMQKSSTPPASSDELRQELDHAIARLPTRLRDAVIVCHLEGRRQEEAARALGCNQGTLSRRVAEGLEHLRLILMRRGIAVTSVALAAYLAEQQAHAAVPTTLLASLKLVATSCSAQAGALADATLRAATLGKLKVAVGLVLAVTMFGLAGLALWLDAPTDRVVLVGFDGASLPVNKAGNPYPRFYGIGGPEDGGDVQASIDTEQAIAGGCLRMQLVNGRLKIHFEPDALKHRTFAHEQAADAGRWRCNTFNRLRFWIRTPMVSLPHRTNGDSNMNVGAYVRRVRDANVMTLEEGGSGFSHRINVPALGHWTQVVLNAHPHTGRDVTGDPGFVPHPTGEPAFNYFDALTRLYIEVMGSPAKYPADYYLDEVAFVRESNPENDEQVYSITATHLSSENRVIVTWSRRTDEDAVRHEVRYAFRSIHEIGWEKAESAPGGLIVPPGKQTRNGMVYDTAALPLAGRKLLFIAIKPENSKRFSQVAVPLTLR